MEGANGKLITGLHLQIALQMLELSRPSDGSSPEPWCAKRFGVESDER